MNHEFHSCYYEFHSCYTMSPIAIQKNRIYSSSTREMQIITSFIKWHGRKRSFLIIRNPFMSSAWIQVDATRPSWRIKERMTCASPVEDCSEQPESKFFFIWNGIESVKSVFGLVKPTSGRKRKPVQCKTILLKACHPQVWCAVRAVNFVPRVQVVNPAPHLQPVWHHHSKVTVLKPAAADSSFRSTMVGKSGKNATILPAWEKRKRRKVCGRDYCNGSEAKFMCRTTCGTCPSECELHVEELEKLTADLQKRLDDLEAKKKERI